MKKKVVTLITALICVVTCVFLAACGGKELNYLKVVDTSTEQLKTGLDIGTYSSDQLGEIKTKLSGLKFIFEYYPDNSTEDADMSKVKIKHFINGDGGHEGLPEQLQSSSSYTIYYYIGHEPTADFSDSLVVSISFSVT